jgi:tetratricopeptide (TPR) repeat protein
MSVPPPFEDRFDRMFGREPDIVQLVARAKRKGATFVVGRPKMGKTWTLQEVARRLTNDNTLVGYHESTGESPDLLLRAVEDLYTRWLSNASFRAQAYSLWQRHRDDWVSRTGLAFGRIVEALSLTTFVGDKVGEKVREGFDWLLMANQDLKTGGLQLQPLAYDQARDLLQIVGKLSGQPLALILDAWEKMPPAALKPQRDTLATFLDHLGDWPTCHIFAGIRHPEVGGDEAGERAANFAEGLSRASPAALVFDLQPMHLDKDERFRMLARIADKVPAAADVDGTSIERLIDGYPGVLDRWWFSSEEMKTVYDLEKEAANGQALRYTEFDRLLRQLSQEERYLACRLAVLPRLDAQSWARIHGAVLDGLSPNLLETLSHCRVLETVRPAPSFGHDTRHEAARKWLTDEPPFREALTAQADQLVVALAGMFSGINEPSYVPVLMLVALSERTASLSISPIPRAFLRAAECLMPDTNLIDADPLDAIDWRAFEGTQAGLLMSAIVNRGVEKGRAGDVAGELADYNAVIELPGAQVDHVARALVNRGIRKGQTGDVAGKLADYTAAIQLPGAPVNQVATALVHRGITKGEAGDRTGELADYSAAIELAGAPVAQVAKALVYRGITKGETGDRAGELADYSAAIELAGAPVDQVAKALVYRGITKGQTGDVAGKLADYSALIELPGAPVDQVAKALINRAITKGHAGDTAGKLADYSAVIDLTGAPVDQVASALVLRGITKGQTGDLAGELVDYSAVIELTGAPIDQVATALVLRGGVKALTGDVVGQLADYSAVIELPEAPVDQVAKALVYRGTTKGLTGDIGGKLADYSTAIELAGAPVDQVAAALVNRGTTRKQTGDVAGALTDFSAVVALPGAAIDQVAKALVNRGITKWQTGDVAGALADFEACIAMSGAPLDLLASCIAFRGLIRAETGNSDSARADLTRALTEPTLPDYLRASVEQALAALGSAV